MLSGGMSLELLGIFGLVTAALALVAGVVHLLSSRLSRGRRRRREALWRELCLRLELVPDAENSRTATGRIQGTDFSLHDTGAAWLVEFPLTQPLLPAGVILLPAREWRLRPGFKLRRLRWARGARPPGPLVWYTNQQLPPSKVEAPLAFLEEAAQAAQAHAPLRVEPHRLIHALPGDTLPSVNSVRDVVRALEATAQRWLEAVSRDGLPRLKALPWVPPAHTLLRSVLAQRALRHWGLANTAGIPLTLGALLLGWQWLFFVLLAAGLYLTRKAAARKHYSFKGLALGVLALGSTFGAPWFWADEVGRKTAPSVLSVRDAVKIPHRNAELFRFDDAVIRTDINPGKGLRIYPVIPEDWRSEEPVTVLAVRPPTGARIHGPLGGTAVSRERALRKAAIDLALSHKFSIHPHAVYVDFSTHPDDARAERRRWALLLWGLPNALWLGVVLTLWRREFRRSRRVLDL
jgi:hypothetical protein